MTFFTPSFLASRLPEPPAAWTPEYLNHIHASDYHFLSHNFILTIDKSCILCACFYRTQNFLKNDKQPYLAAFFHPNKLDICCLLQNEQTHTMEPTAKSPASCITDVLQHYASSYYGMDQLIYYSNSSEMVHFFNKHSDYRFYESDILECLADLGSQHKRIKKKLAADHQLQRFLNVPDIPDEFIEWGRQQFPHWFIQVSRKKKNITFTCPFCHQTVHTDTLHNHQLIECPHCHTPLKALTATESRHSRHTLCHSFFLLQTTSDPDFLILRQFLFFLTPPDSQFKWYEVSRCRINTTHHFAEYSCAKQPEYEYNRKENIAVSYSPDYFFRTYGLINTYKSVNPTLQHPYDRDTFYGKLWTGNWNEVMKHTPLNTIQAPESLIISPFFSYWLSCRQENDFCIRLFQEGFPRLAFQNLNNLYIPESEQTPLEDILNIPPAIFHQHLPAIQNTLIQYDWPSLSSLWRIIGNKPYGPEFIELLLSLGSDELNTAILHLLQHIDIPSFESAIHYFKPFLTNKTRLTHLLYAEATAIRNLCKKDPLPAADELFKTPESIHPAAAAAQ